MKEQKERLRHIKVKKANYHYFLKIKKMLKEIFKIEQIDDDFAIQILCMFYDQINDKQLREVIKEREQNQ